MADLSIRFPPLISLNAVGGPQFNTSVSVMASGVEQRSQNWQLERGMWIVSHSARRPEDWEPLLAFFRIVAGQAHTFRFKDWVDYICLNGQGFFVDSLGSPTLKQMVKRYTFEGYTHDRFITKPVSGKITTDATGLDYSTGLASTGTTWYGEFDCWARLGNDPMRCQVIDRSPSKGLLVGWNGIEIIEVIGEAT